MDLEYLKKYGNKKTYLNDLERLKKGEPVQYIIGNVDFYGIKINVNKNVLIPRFETEQFVEKTIKYINEMFNEKIDIIDLGCGSGCISIALKKLTNSNVTSIDISPDALKIAKENAEMNDVEINFILNDMLDGIDEKFDIIISNPPYISENEEIMEIVKNNEPHLALYAPNDGLYFYEEILKKAKNNLKEKALIAFEIGETQGEKIKKLSLKYLPSFEVKIEKDLYNRDRFVFIKRNKL